MNNEFADDLYITRYNYVPPPQQLDPADYSPEDAEACLRRPGCRRKADEDTEERE